MRYYKAPDKYNLTLTDCSMFLGGSIEMGTAENWQDRLAKEFSEYSDELVILNPRRIDWDSSWTQDPTPGTQFHEQVSWELSSQEDADICVYYFDPKTTSPITLMELGAFGRYADSYVVVCCPPDYFRYGNVAVFCDKYELTLVHTFEELVNELKDVLSEGDIN